MMLIVLLIWIQVDVHITDFRMKLILVLLILSVLMFIDARYTDQKKDGMKENPTTPKSKDEISLMPITDSNLDVTSEGTTQSTQNDLNSDDADEEESSLDIEIDTKSNYGSKQKKHIENESAKITKKKSCAPDENCLTSKVLQLNSPCDVTEEEENLCEKQVKNSECRKGSCVCKESFVNVDDIFCLSGKKALGDSCFLRAQCQELVPGSECVKGLCTCHHTVLSPKPGEGCITALKIGEACSKDYDCSSGTPNSVCSKEKECECQKGAITSPKGECILGKNLGETCIGNPCLDENAICNNKKCECKKHFINVENVCISEKKLNEACLNNGECMVKHSVCQSGSCICDSEFLNWEDTLCLQGNVSIGDSCRISAQCKSPSVENKIVVCAKPYKSDEESICLEIPIDMDISKHSEDISHGKKENKLEKTESEVNMEARSSNKYMNAKKPELESETDELEESSTEITKLKKSSQTNEKITTKLITVTTTAPMAELTTMKSYETKSNKKDKISDISTSIPDAIVIESTSVPTSLDSITTTETLISSEDSLSKLYESAGSEYDEYEATESAVTWKIVKPSNNHYGSHNSQQTKQDSSVNVDPQSLNGVKDTRDLGNKETTENNKKTYDISKLAVSLNPVLTTASSEEKNNKYPIQIPSVTNKDIKNPKSQEVDTNSKSQTLNNTPKKKKNNPYIDPSIAEMDD